MHAFQFIIGAGAQIAHQIPGSLMGQVVAEERKRIRGRYSPTSNAMNRPMVFRPVSSTPFFTMLVMADRSFSAARYTAVSARVDRIVIV